MKLKRLLGDDFKKVILKPDQGHFYGQGHLIALRPIAMKKVISILFLIIYLSVGFGASIDCHYCAGKLVNLKICGIALKSTCPMKSMHSDCCKNRVHLCKSDNHKSPTVAVVTTPENSLKVPVYLLDADISSAVTIVTYNKSHLPPGDVFSHMDCPLFISNRVFRI